MNRKDWVLLITFVALCLIVMSIGANGQDFYTRLNECRKARLLKPLVIDTALETQSTNRIEIIKIRYQGALVHGRCAAGQSEVLAKNCDLDCWLESPGHKKILLNRKARRIGFVMVDGIACARLEEN